MEGKSEGAPGALDTVKLVLAIAILIGGIAGYYVYPDASVLLRVGGVIAALALAILIATQTSQGRQFLSFARGARVELRKVVWPTRQETTQTTIAVIIFAIIMGVFFWLLDLFLLWATSTLMRGS